MSSAKQAPNPSDRVSGTASDPVWVGIDHVQLAIPSGSEDEARRFYVDVLGLTEVPKPPLLAARGGAWFEAGAVRLHVGGEEPFVAAKKAHPALMLSNLGSFVDGRGIDATWNDEIEGLVRCHIFDPFGNRIELVQS
jgi:catechol 2,3-dioxygenase-like lactoylglutathione lyase family enzyme